MHLVPSYQHIEEFPSLNRLIKQMHLNKSKLGTARNEQSELQTLCGLRNCVNASFQDLLRFTPLSILGESCDINTWPGLHHDILPPRWLPTDSCLTSLCVRMSVCTPAGHDVTRSLPAIASRLERRMWPPEKSFHCDCVTWTKQILVVLLHDAVAFFFPPHRFHINMRPSEPNMIFFSSLPSTA